MVTPSRQDLTLWAMHFIHDRNPSNDPNDLTINYDHYEGFPYHEDRVLNSRFDDWDTYDRENELEPDTAAFHVLLKIIKDGHIRASWAFRNNRPTIYGPRAAVCFTEMPLYALLDYARKRRKSDVGTYTIGVLKHELFVAGGRPVIYGLSGGHVEQPAGALSNQRWPRKLDPSCGLAESEQYRYVAMTLDSTMPIDWSHEREWRWVDHEDRCRCPGLPIWLADEPISFRRVFIVVQTSTEVERVLDLLKELHDDGANNYDWPFYRATLENTSVVSLDSVGDNLTEKHAKTLRLEDIPKSEIETFRQPKVTPEFVKEVGSVLSEARKAADDAAEAFMKTAARTKDGRHVADVAGWAHLVVYEAQSPLVSALLELNSVYAAPGEGYIFRDLGGLGWGSEQALSVAEAAVRAAQEVFEEHFLDNTFRIRTRWD